ncbi:alpha/beta hydrolase [Thalassospira sp. MA62]|nr:alpha/beta hydrolase [Thalassospira sp. MA62]
MTSPAFQQTGHASPDGMPVVFLSGMLADQRMWHPTLQAWQDQCQARHGMIDPIFCELFDQDSVSAMAAKVLSVAPDTFALVGMSMGGYVAFEILRQAPERVSHLMLVNTQATEDPPAIKRRRILLSRIAARNRPFVGISDALIDDMIHADNRADENLIGLLAAMALDCGPDVFVRQSHAVAHRPDSLSLLAQITIPTSVMVGESDQVIPVQSHCDMADGINGATFCKVAGAAHYVPLEQPLVFTNALADLLVRPSPISSRA